MLSGCRPRRLRPSASPWAGLFIALLLVAWTLPRSGFVEHAHPYGGPHQHAYREVLQLLEKGDQHLHHHASPHPHPQEVFFADAHTDNLHSHYYDDSLLTIALTRHSLIVLGGVVLLIFHTTLAPPEQNVATLHARAPPVSHLCLSGI